MLTLQIACAIITMYDNVEHWAYFVVYMAYCNECTWHVSHNNRQIKCHKKRMESKGVTFVLGGFFGWCTWRVCRHAGNASQNQKILFLQRNSNAVLVQLFAYFNFAHIRVIKGKILWI